MSEELDPLNNIGGEMQYVNSGMRDFVCPVCTSSTAHMEEPTYCTDEDCHGKGDRLTVPFWSECGSKWILFLRYSKGMTGICTKVIKSCEEKKRCPSYE